MVGGLTGGSMDSIKKVRCEIQSGGGEKIRGEGEAPHTRHNNNKHYTQRVGRG